MIIRHIGAVVGFTTILSAYAGANLLTNPSFENGTGAVTFSPSGEFGGADAFELSSPSSEIDGWFWEQTNLTFGGAAWLEEGSGDIFGTDGSHLLYLDTNQCIQWQDTATISAGETLTLDYNFAAWSRGQDNSPASSGDATILLEYNYRDTNDIVVFGSYTGPGDIVAPGNASNPPAGLIWIDGSYNFAIPADYMSDFNFLITTTGDLLMDDLSITQIPEPRSASLLGLGLVALLLRRARRA